MVSSVKSRGIRAAGSCVVLVATFAGATIGEAAPFPDPRPANRAEAVSMLCAGVSAAGPCVRSRLPEVVPDTRFGVPSRRAVAMLMLGLDLPESSVFPGPDAVKIRYSTAEGRPDRIDPADGSRNGVPDVVEGVALGAWQARGLLQRQLELPRPSLNEVVLVELGDRLDGYIVPNGSQAFTLVLDATPADGPEGARRAAIRLYGYAAARGSAAALPARWAEAVGAWTAVSIDGAPDASAAAEMSARGRMLHTGLDTPDPILAAGNALFLAFLEEAHGLAAVRAAIEELGRSLPVPAALDLALRRSSREDLRTALREFHLWSVLVGERADRHHLRFAGHLEPPAFASAADGLPAIAIREAPPVAPLGASHMRFAFDEPQGGLQVRFEGDLLATWEADLLLVGEARGLRRVPLYVSAEGRGEITVPIRGVREALLLVRNLDSADGESHRYSVTAFHEPSFPFELVVLDARRIEESTGDVLVTWETASERSLVGFNVLRADVDSGREVVVNPVWIPAMGDRTDPATYRFLDRDVDPRRAYTYRIEGITTEGIPAASRSVPGPPPAP